MILRHNIHNGKAFEFVKTYRVLCKDCDHIFLATDEHHHMDYCPRCPKESQNGVDIETYCIRLIGNVEILEE